MSTATQDILESALDYAERGWRVVMLHHPTPAGCSCGKAGCPAAGKHPRFANWQVPALVPTYSPADIERLWSEFPGSNVGVQLGPTSALIDCEYDSAAELAAYLDLFDNEPPATAAFRSSTAERKHHMFKYRSDLPGGGVLDYRGLKIRAGNDHKGAQSVFPPSLHASGARYTWLVHPDDCPPQPIPDHVVEKLRKVAGGNGAAGREGPRDWGRILGGVPEGSRNHDMAALIGKRLASCALSEQDVQLEWEFARSVNDRNKPPLDEGELRRLFDNILQRERARRNGNKSDSPRPIIWLGVDEPRVVNEAVAALATRDDTFVRAGLLAHVVRETDPPKGIVRPKGTPRIVALQKPTLRERLADSAAWQHSQGENKPPSREHPPTWAVNAVHARGQWPGVRRLEGITEVPVLRSDGSILQAPGYDEATGLLFMPQEAFPEIPEKPDHDAVMVALEALYEVVQDFPFKAPTDRAAWLAGLLTPLSRYAFHGSAPLVFIHGNQRGTGKGLLADVTGVIVTGRELSRMVVPEEDDEVRKRISAIGMAGDSMVLMDNAAGHFGSPALDAALTATSWCERILGTNEMLTVPISTTFYATGNNVIFRADTARRVLAVRLESKEEKPEARTGFRHADLRAWVLAERPRLAPAALTILAGYMAAGRPDQGLPAWGSYDAWSGLVRNTAKWATGIDPAGGRDELMAEADEDATTLKALLDGWEELDPKGLGFTASEALKQLGDYPVEYQVLRSVLWEAFPTKDGKFPTPRLLGNRLRRLRRRVMGGRYFDGKPGRLGEVWSVRFA